MKRYIVTEPSGLIVQIFANSLADAVVRCTKGEGYPMPGVQPHVYTYNGENFTALEIAEICE